MRVAHVSLQAQHRLLIQPDQSSAGAVEIGYERDDNRDDHWHKNQRQLETPRQGQTTCEECDQRNQEDQEPNGTGNAIFKRGKALLMEINHLIERDHVCNADCGSITLGDFYHILSELSLQALCAVSGLTQPSSVRTLTVEIKPSINVLSQQLLSPVAV